MANESTGTGVAELDRALDGLYWGDNVVWVWEGNEPPQGLFYDAIAQRRGKSVTEIIKMPRAMPDAGQNTATSEGSESKASPSWAARK